MINVYAINIKKDEINDATFNNLMSLLDINKQERIRNFLHHEDAIRTLLAEVLIRKIICDDLNIINKDIAFGKNEYGKPFLKNVNDFHFNISHSENWVVCATSRYEVGIDIEYVKPIDFEIAKRYFSKDEYRDLMIRKFDQRLSFFYDLWTLKESYIKAVGKGLSIPLNSFCFIISQAGKIQGDKSLDGWIFKQYNIERDYKMSVCSAEKDFLNYVIIKDVSELYNLVVSTSTVVGSHMKARTSDY